VEWRNVRGIAFLQDGEVRVTPPRTRLKNLDQLPFGASYFEHSVGVDLQLQPEFIITARGCPSACHFCSSPTFWGRKVQFRSPENIVTEIEYIRDVYGLIYYSLRDDTFTADRARTIEFCRQLIERRIHIMWNCQSRVTTLDEELLVWMKRAGCECIQLGVESGAQRILSQLGKTITPVQVEHAADLIRKVGINLSIYLISDIPGETDEDVLQTIDLVRRIRPDDGYVSPLAYFPGTRLFEEAVANGIIDRAVFDKTRDAALFVADKRGGNSRRLLKCLSNGFANDSARFKEQKLLLGYCYTTNVLAGEFYRQNGEFGHAEREFREIVEQDTDNPWGWYLLAELYAEIGRVAQSAECYHAVCRIVPKHGPSQLALRPKKKRGHDGPASY
jgi:pyruvate-formate lyase-activating enzyme